MSAGAAARSPTWVELDRLDCCPPGSWSPRTLPAPRWSSPTSTAHCSPTGTPARRAAVPSTAASSSEGALRCPQCARTFFLPRAGRSMDDDRLQLEPVPLLRERRQREGGAWRRDRERRQLRSPGWCEARIGAPVGRRGGGGAPPCAGVSRACAASSGRPLRRTPMPPPPNGATSAARASPATTATCCTWSSAGSSASARAAGRCAPAMPSTARPATAPSGCPTSSCPTTCGRASRSRSGSRSSWTRPPPAAWSPSTRARPARPRASCTSHPGAGWWS